MAAKFPDAAIDLETLSTRPDAAIVSFGVVWFDRSTGVVGPSIYHEIGYHSAVKSGHVDGNKVAWWLRQGDAARALFSDEVDRLKNKTPLATALHALINGWREHATYDCRPWGYGSTFDVSVLEHAYIHAAVGLQCPWQATFRQVRDARTWIDAAELRGFKLDSVPAVGVKHNALADAQWLANAVIAATTVLEGSKEPAAKRSTKKVVEDDY